MFALVLPDLGDAAVDRPYTYAIPPHLADSVVVGGRVMIPLGSRRVGGFVLDITPDAESPLDRMKSLISVLSPHPAFTVEQAALARWMAETYLCPLSDALRLCLADGAGVSATRRWRGIESAAVTTLLPDPTLQAVLAHIRTHASVSTTQIRRLFGNGGVTALDVLQRDGLIAPMRNKAATAREVTVVVPALPADELLSQADAVPARAAKQAALLRWMANNDLSQQSLTIPEVARRAGVSEAVVRACIDKGWLRADRLAVRRNPWDDVEGRKPKPPALTTAQTTAVEAIAQAVRARRARTLLLYGVTGSGKTEVFLHAIEETLATGRQAIVLVPEISLTAQAMALYQGRFPGQVAVLHSHLSTGERYDEWQRIASGEAQVVLGARSALFAPCPDLGLIVIDEEHESSYKQESSPRYHAKAVALERGKLCDAPVVLASATPSLESMREAELGRHQLLTLPDRIESRPLPVVKLVDLKRMTSGARVLSAPLRQAIAARLERGEQTILFLNRRGYSHSLLCKECGQQAECPECAVALTYHMRDRLLRCHHCDHQHTAPDRCPSCGGLQIIFKGTGTERLEDEVQHLWPTARIGRMDRDTTAHKGAHQAILNRFEREETDILIGTQMVAKGLDFPKVTLVGVISADTSLGIPDFRAPERTFQLLTQVAGRAGRSEWPGEVYVQTYQPDHYAIQAAMTHDYDAFYRQEIIRRGEAEACWPPLTALVNVVISGADESEVKATAGALARRARESGAVLTRLPAMPDTAVLPGLFEFLELEADPAETEEEDPYGAEALLQRDIPDSVIANDATPCPLERLRGRYRYHVVLRAQNREALLRMARHMRELTPPRSVQVVIDVDPLTLA